MSEWEPPFSAKEIIIKEKKTMANFIDKLMNVMKLGDTEAVEDEMEMDAEERIEESVAQNIRPARREVKLDAYEKAVERAERERPMRSAEGSYAPKYERSSRPQTGNVVNFHASVQMEVVVIQPATYDEAQVIADHIRSQRPVIVNLEKLDYSIAQRIMDFVSGAVYTLGGNLERVTQNIFIIAPENVDIAGHFQEELKSNGIILPWKSE